MRWHDQQITARGEQLPDGVKRVEIRALVRKELGCNPRWRPVALDGVERPTCIGDQELVASISTEQHAHLARCVAGQWDTDQAAIAKQVEGSVAAANQSEADRTKIRRVLGSSTMQILNLK